MGFLVRLIPPAGPERFGRKVVAEMSGLAPGWRAEFDPAGFCVLTGNPGPKEHRLCLSKAFAEYRTVPLTRRGEVARRYARIVLLSGIDSLPVGLLVTHTPERVDAPIGPNPKCRDWRYRWVFQTCVSAIDRPVRVAHFGILAWDGSKWILPLDQRRYNAGVLDGETFAQWYVCPGGRVEPGKSAVDPQNWAGSHELASFKQKWFFVGVDAEGACCKGEAVVELVANDRCGW